MTFILWRKDIIYQYINSFQINCFWSITLKFILSLVSRGLGALQCHFGRYRCAAEIAKTPQCIYYYQMKPEFTCYNLLTTLTRLARVVLRNDASPSDGDNKRLVCVRRDQCHDHIKDMYPEKSRLMSLQGPLLHSPEWRVTSLVSIHYEEVIFKVK